jgi:uncharacterized protein (DUF1330 family)
MPAYFVAIREMTISADELKLYQEMVPSSMVGHDARALAAYGEYEVTEGDPIEGAVILEFPTLEEAHAWYNSPLYQRALQHRLSGAKYRTFIFQGVPGTP